MSKLERGEDLRLPLSKEYLGIEVQNILNACNDMLSFLANGRSFPPLSSERVKFLNAQVLRGLETDDDVVPGETRLHEVGGLPLQRLAGAGLRAFACAHVQLAEQNEHSHAALPFCACHNQGDSRAFVHSLDTHPFGDGNWRTARLVEHQILLSSGVPSPAAQLLSNHYNETRQEYYRQLDKSSRVSNGAVEFALYALQGFVDGLEFQMIRIKEQIWRDMWVNYVHSRFQGKNGPANSRRRRLALALFDCKDPISRREIRRLTLELTGDYNGKTDMTITRAT